MLKGKKGQSILEYVVVLTAIIATIIAVGAPAIQRAVRQTIDDSERAVVDASTRLPLRVDRATNALVVPGTPAEGARGADQPEN